MKETKIILNKTQNHSERYTLINGSMGSHGTPANHANRRYEIANGVDRGNGYQGYTSVSYFLTQEYVPQEAKNKVIEICKKQGLSYTD